MADYTVTGLRPNQPFEQTTQETGTNTISDVFTLTTPAKISDLQWMLPSGDTLTVTIDFEGDGTHTATLYTSTATSGAALSGRTAPERAASLLNFLRKSKIDFNRVSRLLYL